MVDEEEKHELMLEKTVEPCKWFGGCVLCGIAL